MPTLTSVTRVKKIILTGLQESDIITRNDCVAFHPLTIAYIYVNPKADE